MLLKGSNQPTTSSSSFQPELLPKHRGCGRGQVSVGNQAQRSIDHVVLEKHSPLQTRGYGRFLGVALESQYIAEQIEARFGSRTLTANPEAAEPMLY
jgi:hypothetical protein